MSRLSSEFIAHLLFFPSVYSTAKVYIPQVFVLGAHLNSSKLMGFTHDEALSWGYPICCLDFDLFKPPFQPNSKNKQMF
ncbi:hypothetical protein XENTR_v10017194 [Xenopus tropicalis]|nr:hypothetical protein XENTR_v10017194 [Xenopus tropicalis]